MENIFIIRNKDVKRVLMGVPKGHKHHRCVIELKDKKPGFATYQLLEAEKNENEILGELEKILVN